MFWLLLAFLTIWRLFPARISSVCYISTGNEPLKFSLICLLLCNVIPSKRLGCDLKQNWVSGCGVLCHIATVEWFNSFYNFFRDSNCHVFWWIRSIIVALYAGVSMFSLDNCMCQLYSIIDICVANTVEFWKLDQAICLR